MWQGELTNKDVNIRKQLITIDSEKNYNNYEQMRPYK